MSRGLSMIIRLFFVLAVIWVAGGGRAAAQIEIQEVTSPGGITAWLYEEHTVPMIAIDASFAGGPALDPEGREGALTLMAGLLEEGAGEYDAIAFAEAREEIAAGMSFGTSRDGVEVSARFLTSELEASAALLRTALLEPRFEERAFERVRAQLLASLAADAENPEIIARRAFLERAFAGHPYGRPADGSIESVRGLTREDMVRAHRDALVRERLTVAVVGDITAERLGPLLDELFADLPASGPPLPEVADPALAGDLEVIEVDVPQSVVVFGQPGIARDDPDFLTAFVVDYVFGGGGFGSRLTQEVREERGLTYGIYTYLFPGDYGWLYQGSFSSANGRVAEAIGIVRDEWRRLRDEGITQAELDAAKRYLTGAYPLRFVGSGQIAAQLLGIQLAGLGMDYVNERNAMIEAVTLEEANRVARELLDPEALSFVVAGQPEGLEETN